ncbi:MAG TPA: isochorismatase family protein [Thermosynechococcaceae cyanobacterium]
MAPLITFPAKPDAIAFSPQETAVIVVDMQNAYASQGGYLDLLGVDLSNIATVIEAIKSAIAASRHAGMQIVFLQNGWSANLHEAGSPASPHWHKSNALRLMREDPALQGKLTIKGTWDYDFIDAIQPQPEDYIVQKPRYSGFFGTNLDMFLRGKGIRNLVLAGVATNVCVESTLRDAFFLEYFALILADATLHIGKPSIQEATLFNIEKFFGWVATTQDYLTALQEAASQTLQPQTIA